jgi:hypothetical protein
LTQLGAAEFAKIHEPFLKVGMLPPTRGALNAAFGLMV